LRSLSRDSIEDALDRHSSMKRSLMLPTSLTRGIVEALTQVSLILVKTLSHVALAGGCVVHGGCLAAAAHDAPSLLLDLYK